MKKILKITGGFIVVLLAILIIIPYFFKDSILEKVESNINDNIEAQLVIGDLSLSMFKSFPKLHIEIENLKVIGKNEFSQDTLIHVGRLYTAANLASVISGSKFEVNSIVLENTKLAAKILKNGKANWDISKNVEQKETTTEEKTKSKESSNFKIEFQEVNVNQFSLVFEDLSNDLKANIDDVNLQLSGDFSAKESQLSLSSVLKGINVNYKKSNYIKETQVKLDAILAANFDQMMFTLQRNRLSINDLHFGLDGNFQMLDNAYKMDLKMNAEKTDFKSLLAMVPDLFQAQLKDLTTSGNLELNAFAKGTYQENHFPSFGANLKVENANVKYANLPESINDIQVNTTIQHPGGELDLMKIDVNKFHFNVSNNPFSAQLHIQNPMSDPQLKGFFKGVIDFAKIRHAIPMDSIQISGQVTSDVNFKGKLSAIEKEEFEKFMAKGKIRLNAFSFSTPDLPQGMKIQNAILSFSPKAIQLQNLNAKIGQSDLKLQGKIENYIAYIFKNEVLKGNFTLNSKLINLNEFMTSSTKKEVKKEVAASTDTIPLSVIPIPKNINFRLQSKISKIHFDKMDISNVKGLIEMKHAKAQLTNLSMNMLKGQLNMNGAYETKEIKSPAIDFGFNMKNFDIKEAYHSLSMIKEMIPIAVNCQGKISSDFKLDGRLDENMNPIMNRINGKGSLHSVGILINENKAFDQLAKALKNDSYRKISVSKFDMEFEIKNGNVIVKPFTTKVAGHPAVIQGTQSIDGKLDFSMELKLPKKDLGKEINQYFDVVPGLDNLPAFDVVVRITGTSKDPKVKLDLSKAIRQAQKAVAKELKRRSRKELEKKGKDLLRKLFK